MTADVDNDVDKLALDSLLVNYYGVTSVNARHCRSSKKGNLAGHGSRPARHDGGSVRAVD